MPHLELNTASIFLGNASHKPVEIRGPPHLCRLVATAIAVLVWVSVMCSGLISNANIYAAVAMFWVPHINGWA